MEQEIEKIIDKALERAIKELESNIDEKLARIVAEIKRDMEKRCNLCRSS